MTKNTTRSHLRSVDAKKCRAHRTALESQPTPTGCAPNHRRGLSLLRPIRAETEARGGRGSSCSERETLRRFRRVGLLGSKCHSLRVLIIWRGVCSARPARLSRWKSRRSWEQFSDLDELLNPVQDRWNSQQAVFKATGSIQVRGAERAVRAGRKTANLSIRLRPRCFCNVK